MPHMVLDTGSAHTLLKGDDLEKIGILPPPTAAIRRMRGVVGTEAVLEFPIPSLGIETMVAAPFTIQMGAVDYGFPMDGILGLDFLLFIGAVIDLSSLEIRAGYIR